MTMTATRINADIFFFKDRMLILPNKVQFQL